MPARLVSVLRPHLGRARRALRRTPARAFAPIAFAVEKRRTLRAAREIALFQARLQLPHRFPPPSSTARARPSAVAAVAHVTDGSRDRETAAGRLAATLDAILESLSEADVELHVHTIPSGHVVEDLPDYLRRRVVVFEHEDVHPMLVGFRAQEQFEDRRDRDWFMFLEDDMLVNDALLLDKLAYFNSGAPEGSVLLPHRYEYLRGERTWIDLVSKASPVPALDEYNPTTALEIGGWKFVEYANPHAAFYCLSRAQLDRWLATGRRWSDKVSFQDALVSAATGCLAEAFRLYKPHPDNMSFLQIRHWDTKYARRTAALFAAAESAAAAASPPPVPSPRA